MTFCPSDQNNMSGPSYCPVSTHRTGLADGMNCQSNLFQDNKTFKEIIGKESWTLRNYRSSWTSILHLMTPQTYESCTPCISCFPIRTLNSEHDPEPNTTPTTSC